ncbi:MAG TPA: DivIVA domain-containing protein [Gaiellaceae bacterium]|nr:DivIVA domain-containing protein [Gaiellaceae bacterium]
MALAPVEIRHVRLGRGMFGYSRAETDRLLEDVADSFEDVWRDRADLADKVEKLEADLVRYKEAEGLLRTTLVSAERAAGDLKEGARRDAERILNEAHAEARAITRRSRGELEHLQNEARRVRVLLQAALASVEPAVVAGAPAVVVEPRAEDEDTAEVHAA